MRRIIVGMVALSLLLALGPLAAVRAEDELEGLPEMPGLDDELGGGEELPPLEGFEALGEPEPMDDGLAGILGDEPLPPDIEDDAPAPFEDLGMGEGMPPLDGFEEEAMDIPGLDDFRSEGDLLGLEPDLEGVGDSGSLFDDLPGAAQERIEVSGVLVRDAYWTPERGEYVITGDFYVAKGVSLYVYPGCRIRVEKSGRGKKGLYTSRGTDIVVAGRIKAVGSPSQPVIFYGADGQDWGNLTITGGKRGSVLKYVRIKRGKLNLVNADPLVVGCEISHGGVRVGKLAKARLLHNRIHGCEDGVRVVDASSQLEMVGNEVYDNGYGLVLKKAGTVVLKHNFYHGNAKGDLDNHSDLELKAE